MEFFSEVTPVEGYKMLLKFYNGKEYLYNFADKLNTCRFYALNDKSLFDDVTTDGIFISWNNGQVILSASEVMAGVNYN